MSNIVAVTNNVTKHVVEVTPDTASTTLVVSQQTAPNVVELNAGLFLGTSDLSSINNLGDVNTSGISTGDFLQYNGAEWVTVAISSGSETLGGLDDVTITSAINGNFLRYNGTNWVNSVIQKSDITDFNEADYATAAQGTTADTALQPGDIGTSVQGFDVNLVSDANYVATDENFTSADHTKLDGIETGAEVNVNSDWSASSGDAQILNKPTLGTAASTDSADYATSAQGLLADSALQSGDNVSELANDSGYLTNIFAASIGQLSDVVLTSPVVGGLLVEQTGGGFLKLGAATWATNYLELSTLKNVSAPSPANGDFLSYDTGTSKWVNSALATVATSGDYNDLTNLPTASAVNTLDGQKVEFFTRSTAYVSGSYEGKVLKFGSATLQASKLYKYGSSGWEPADANVTGKAEGMLGISLGTSESSDGLLVDGLITSSLFSSFSSGDIIYVSETEGEMTNTAPTAINSVVRIVGYALGSSYIHFNPSDNFIELG